MNPLKLAVAVWLLALIMLTRYLTGTPVAFSPLIANLPAENPSPPTIDQELAARVARDREILGSGPHWTHAEDPYETERRMNEAFLERDVAAADLEDAYRHQVMRAGAGLR